MIPNLTLIIGAYVVMRLVTMALRQFPEVEKKLPARVAIVVGAVLAVTLVTICTLDTVGVGLSVGSTLDAKRGRPF